MKILIIEDSTADLMLIERQLKKSLAQFETVHVSAKPALLARLQSPEQWDLVIADYKVPGLPFEETFSILQAYLPLVPLIVVSGTVGEEKAVELIKKGVSDLVLKENLSRLDPVVGRALREASERRARHHAESKLREQAEILDAATDSIVVRSLDDRILYWNRSAEIAYGWKAEEVIGKHVSDVLYSRSMLRFEEALAILFKEGDFSGRIVHTKRDGTLVTVQSHWILVRENDGSPKSILAIHTDLTDRLDLEERLFQSEKLESLGKMTGGIAHDFNNLLTVILGCSEMLAERANSDAELKELSEMIQVAGQAGADLTDRLLSFAKRQAMEPETFDVGQAVTRLKALLQRTLGAQITLHVKLADDVPPAHVDPAQFEAALVNLCINAADAMSNGGVVEVSVSLATLDGHYASRWPSVKPGRYIKVSVQDSGTGIAPEARQRIFEPFFTTKGSGKHSGLGLSAVYGFVMQSKGHIDVISQIGSGTTIELYLPIALTSGASSPFTEATAVPFSHESGEHVLVVEDDPMVREIGSKTLCQLGYQVKAVGCAAEAIRLLQDTSFRCDLLFTDVLLPHGMNGPQLAMQAGKLRSNLPVLFTSGYVSDEFPHADIAIGRHLLKKPYSKEQLALKIRETLALQST